MTSRLPAERRSLVFFGLTGFMIRTINNLYDTFPKLSPIGSMFWLTANRIISSTSSARVCDAIISAIASRQSSFCMRVVVSLLSGQPQCCAMPHIERTSCTWRPSCSRELPAMICVSIRRCWSCGYRLAHISHDALSTSRLLRSSPHARLVPALRLCNEIAVWLAYRNIV